MILDQINMVFTKHVIDIFSIAFAISFVAFLYFLFKSLPETFQMNIIKFIPSGLSAAFFLSNPDSDSDSDSDSVSDSDSDSDSVSDTDSDSSWDSLSDVVDNNNNQNNQVSTNSSTEANESSTSASNPNNNAEAGSSSITRNFAQTDLEESEGIKSYKDSPVDYNLRISKGDEEENKSYQGKGKEREK